MSLQEREKKTPGSASLSLGFLSSSWCVDENWGSPEHTQGKGMAREGKQGLSKVNKGGSGQQGVLSWDSSFAGWGELS